MKKEIKVQSVFAKDGMFLADNGRLYRFEITDGKVRAFSKFQKTKVEIRRVYLEDDNRDGSRFWVVDTCEQKVYRKDKHGKLVEEIATQWGSMIYRHFPLVFGDLLFIISELQSDGKPVYRVLQAKRDSYKDITATFGGKNVKIVEAYGVQGYVDGEWTSYVNVKIQNSDGSFHSVNRQYHRRSKIEKTEKIEYIEMKNLSEEVKQRLLQGK